MVKVQVSNQEYYMDGYLKENLEIVRDQIINHDSDFVGIVDGFEGVGKSVLAQQIGLFVDPTLDMDRICFTSEEYKDAVEKAKPGHCVIYDEAITGAFNREAIQQMNIILIKMMAQVRQKNLFMLFVLPSFMDLDKNLALWRSKFLIHCHYGPNFQRGFFRFANLEKKKKIFIEGQKTYYYPKDLSAYNFFGRFPKHYTVNERKYKAKKLKSFSETDYTSISLRKTRSQRDSLIMVLLAMDYSQEQIAEFSDLFDEGLTRQMISIVQNKYSKLQKGNIPLVLKSIQQKVGERQGPGEGGGTA